MNGIEGKKLDERLLEENTSSNVNVQGKMF